MNKNHYEAYLWAHKSATKGLAKAEFVMGYLMDIGIGVERDIDEAKRWYQRAAGQGNKRAMARVNEMNIGKGVRPVNTSEWRSIADARNGECVLM